MNSLRVTTCSLIGRSSKNKACQHLCRSSLSLSTSPNVTSASSSSSSSSSQGAMTRAYVETWLGNDLKGNSGVQKPGYICNSTSTTSSSSSPSLPPQAHAVASESFALKITSLQRRIKDLEAQLAQPSSSSPSSSSSLVASPSAMIHYGTVRSGQQIYAEGRSLIVVGSVNSGGELMADGDIHVYGMVFGMNIYKFSLFFFFFFFFFYFSVKHTHIPCHMTQENYREEL